jgi:hypothetical protein
MSVVGARLRTNAIIAFCARISGVMSEVSPLCDRGERMEARRQQIIAEVFAEKGAW